MRELESNEILDMKFINQETGEVIMTYPVTKIKELKEFVDFELIVAEDDYWGRWNQNTVEWLLEFIDKEKLK